ncbi:N-6 DNA methylase [Streptomyces sp. MMS24-I29]|uniref:N-6 DNA methylase n=1 Tax=Streptomyces sp. MMS24-I29 TaxID=3351480 RepID=UPI003C7C6458
MTQYHRIVRLLTANTGARRLADVFEDFVEMAALAVRNAVDRVGRARREEQYRLTAGRYTREQLGRFAEALALVVETMGEDPGDVLGRLYMELELGNKHIGQFYTPHDVSRLTAAMSAEAFAAEIAEQGFIRLYEPACGAASLVIAVTQELRQSGFDYQMQLHVTAEDIAPQAVHMAYINLALLHVPAVVHRRDTLTQKTFDTWHTPAHVFGGWTARLRHAADRRKRSESCH